MEVANYKCDICGRIEQTEEYASPKGWYSVTLTTEDESNFWHKHKDICSGCGTGLLSEALSVLERVAKKRGCPQ